MQEEATTKKRCPWCPNPEGCSSCSVSGDDESEDRRSYTLVPLASVDRMLDRIRRRWMILVSVLTGALLGAMVIGLALIYVLISMGRVLP